MDQKGSFTIEASVIFSLIFLVLAGSISFGIYMHDQVCLKAITHQVITGLEPMYHTQSATERLEEGLYLKSMEDQVHMLEEDIKNLSRQMLIGTDISNLEIDFQRNNRILYQDIEIVVKADFKMPIQWVKIVGSQPELVVSSRISSYDAPEMVRFVDFVDNMSSEFTVTHTFKQKYMEILEKVEEILEKYT